jgi:hypothetical protein
VGRRPGGDGGLERFARKSGASLDEETGGKKSKKGRKSKE